MGPWGGCHENEFGDDDKDDNDNDNDNDNGAEIIFGRKHSQKSMLKFCFDFNRYW